ncbi:hypothetical protein Syun_014818 [Stephania yunnanensis]|uniref:Uncharacterized protein n=1 Tax=Stephania yunnanensis TaxID=152371 RepID=A0AAP0P8V7_9MAGN
MGKPAGGSGKLVDGDADAGEELDSRGGGAAPVVTPAVARRRRQRCQQRWWCGSDASSGAVATVTQLQRRRGERRDGIVGPIGGVTSTNFNDAMEVSANLRSSKEKAP